MKKDTSYHDFVVFDLMVRLPEITSRRMMSGWCIYSAGIPFAAIIGNELYLKARGVMAEKLASLGSRQFSYEKNVIVGAGTKAGAKTKTKTKTKTIKMAYWSVPEEMLDNQEAFDELAREVIGELD